MKQRKIGLMILLSFVTLGIYNIVWNYKFQDELREDCGKGILPSGHILINLVPIVGICYMVYWFFAVDSRIKFIGGPGGNLGILYVFLSLTVIGGFFVPAIIQSRANNLSVVETKNTGKKQDLRVDKYAKYFNK